jgi:transposase-like protein
VTGTSYTEAFKAQIVAKLTTSGRPVQEFAKELGLHPGLLYRKSATKSGGEIALRGGCRWRGVGLGAVALARCARFRSRPDPALQRDIRARRAAGALQRR